ncbi:Gfo/Idh/MocA family oxidoreductase [Streptomyces sp. ACA25]|uniref:Gfo/Idh/MocA family protein n=1 Tax=Streptomyces sp. ACA25 TaxID=3022596 RepID=UPI00230819EB|nr:Gfo/Idh/MocA family oxidoreductase [Streptomyces sp. ACA25]MDB1088482.1 Gfo/Idh/MocA family oxidoreductase [Streptomyces sp. ACA25]
MRIVLAGAHGFGRTYLGVLREAAEDGRAELAGICDLRPVPAGALEGLGSPAQSGDLAGLVKQTAADVVIVATPIHTHVPLALTALRAGAHLLLEKPPAPSLAEFDRLLAATREHGALCQVGFQSLGSAAPRAVRRMITDGLIGAVRGIGAAGAWSRDTSYYRRASWAGRRRLDGTDVVDGALTNPFAHAVATVLALDGGEITSIETELFHAFDIEADDTSCLRVRTSGGLADGAPLTVAVTLAAPEQRPPVITVHGERGRISLWYTLDQVRLERAGEPSVTTTYERTGLLADLLARLEPGGESGGGLLVPLSATRPFTQVLEAVRTAEDPLPLRAEEHPAQDPSTGAVRRVVPGITDLVTASAERLALFSELPQFSGPAGRHV